MEENIHIKLFLGIYDRNSSLLKHMKHFLSLAVLFSVRISLPALFILLILSPASSFPERTNTTNTYVGSDACKTCHEKEYTSFMKYAKKSKSYESIQRVKKGLTEEEIKGCYFCHTTGYGKPGGFVSIEKTPHLRNAGCEVCHGPSGLHAETLDPSDTKRRMSMEDCEVCHTSERVKAFRYKPMIHGGAH